MKWWIVGDNLQGVRFELEPGESIYAEAGCLVWMGSGIEMTAEMKGGILGAIKRLLTKESIFLTKFTARFRDYVELAMPFPGKIVAADASKGIIAQKEAFIAMEPTVNTEVHITGIGAGLWGGEGFVMQKFTGTGKVFFGAAGNVEEFNLGPGQVILVSTGKVVAFESTVRYDISAVKDVKAALFGGEGLLMTRLEGPGKVWVQTTSLEEFARALTTKKAGTTGLAIKI